MPTNKTPFTFNIKDEYLEKHLCKLHIEKYEEENGEIKLENIEDIDESPRT